MSKIAMVKCFILKSGDDPINRECRYVPLNEFEFWKYYMEQHNQFQIFEEVESLWIDEEEKKKYPQIYKRLDLEEVKEIKIFVFSYKTQLIMPVTRYIEESKYKEIKRVLVSHYSEPNKNAVREIKERNGYWIKR